MVMKPPFRCVRDTGFVKNIPSIGDRGEQPVEAVFVSALGKESDDSEEVTSSGAEVGESWGSEREF